MYAKMKAVYGDKCLSCHTMFSWHIFIKGRESMKLLYMMWSGQLNMASGETNAKACYTLFGNNDEKGTNG